MKPENIRYNWLQKQFHWWTVPLLIALITMGLVMTDLPLSKLKQDLYAWHKWIGIIVLLLAIARLSWRAISPPVAEEGGKAPAYAGKLAKFGHATLYLLLILIPLIGWARSSTAGFQVVLFGMIPLPDLMGKNEALSENLSELHEILAYGLIVLAIGHIGAVIMHHKKWQDPILDKIRPSLLHKALVSLSVATAGLFFAYYGFINPPAATEKPQPIIENQQPEEKEAQLKSKQQKKGPWQISKSSSLAFTATQKGSKTEGIFKSFELKELTFDPETPEKASVTVVVDVASLSFGNAMLENTLRASGWFEAETFPKATFTAKDFQKTGENQYQLDGELRIKDITHPLTLALNIEKTTTPEGEIKISARGNGIINRLTYKIGQGEWESPEMLDPGVTINITVDALKAQ